MPHRAGYFALAYSWDHHCEDLFRSLRAGYYEVRRQLNELSQDKAANIETLCNYYKKWHYNRELFHHLAETTGRKIFTINSLGYRGYGVNQDLLKGLEALEREENAFLGRLLDETFLQKIDILKCLIYLPQECVAGRSSEYIVRELCNKMEISAEGQLPKPTSPARLDLKPYFSTMSDETSWQTNTAIFQRLFFRMGLSSATLMSGSTGLYDPKPPGELKKVGNENFREMCKYIFDTLHTFTPIGLDLLRHIHYLLSRGLDDQAGEFRRIDFPDRNGVTFEFDNFTREIGELAWVMSETAQTFDDLPSFIHNMARSYYMFISIHPFWDSNGRVGRAFVNQMFMKKGLPPISFYDTDEIFALPRYGGSMEDMHNYIKARIVKGVSDYFYERSKLDSFGFLNSPIYNMSFDSGFLFCRVDQGIQKIDVQFTALVIDDGNPLAKAYRDRCRVVLPNDFALHNIVIYYGFAGSPAFPWKETAKLQHNFYIRERESEIVTAREFDVEFVIELHGEERIYEFFSCSVAYEQDGLLFDNKGLNYCYRLW